MTLRRTDLPFFQNSPKYARDFKCPTDAEKVTIYFKNTFGISKIEAKLLVAGNMKYAQYDSIPFIHYVKKGERKVSYILQTYDPYFVVCKGWNLPNPDDVFETVEKTETTEIKRSKYSCYDSRYGSEFDSKLASWADSDKIEILIDVRKDDKQHEMIKDIVLDNIQELMQETGKEFVTDRDLDLINSSQEYRIALNSLCASGKVKRELVDGYLMTFRV